MAKPPGVSEYVVRMEDVLDLYAEEPDPDRPAICFDESPFQLIGEVREPIPAKPGQTERFDCEYKRNGTANLFVFLDVHHSWRNAKMTDWRAAQDFAQCMRDMIDLHSPPGRTIRVVMDNLSTHSPSYLSNSFPPAHARRIVRRLEFQYTAKHASWLNMVEIEIGVQRTQCLDRRIDNQNFLVSEVPAWERRRNGSGERINWMFSTQKASEKLDKAYPKLEAMES